MILSYNGHHPRIGKNVFIAPTAVLIGDVDIANGASIWYGAVLRGDMDPIQIYLDLSRAHQNVAQT
jgi:carbonic anhydrase/acetyltransferase-like protein (isoleucine patch superfamily)